MPAAAHLTVKVAEDDFMRKERDPFKGGGPVRGGTANEHMLAVAMPDQPGLSKLPDDHGAGKALRNDVIQFHMRRVYARGWDNGCPSEKKSVKAIRPGMEAEDGARCRFRTYDPYRVKVMLYH